MSNGAVVSGSAPGREFFLVRWMKALRRLFSTPREHYRSSSKLFPELDLNAVRVALKPRERGQETGSHNTPRAESPGLDATEKDIVAFFVGEQNRAHDRCLEQLRVFDERVQSVELNVLNSNVAAKVQAAAADLRALATRGRNELFDLQRQVESLARELSDFRYRHRINREPRYPESHLWHWGVLSILLFLETSLNGVMLSRGTAGGLLEGFTQALILAALNLSLGGLIGRVTLPLSVHVQPLIKIVGVLTFVVAVVTSASFNLLVGHYRDALGGSAPEDAAGIALQTFVSQPFSLSDVASWMLFALGILFAVTAAVDTFRMDDPYWGFGHLARRNQTVRNDFIAERQHLMNGAIERRDQALEEVHAVMNDIGRAGQRRTDLLQQQLSVVKRFDNYQEYLERVGATLLSEYRNANEAARSTPAPPHFAEEWRLQRVSVAPPGREAQDLGKLSSTLEQHREDIMSAFSVASDQIKSVGDLVGAGEKVQENEHTSAS